MGKKITNVLLFLLIFAAAVVMTVYVGRDDAAVLIYNFIFLAVTVLLYLAALFAGMFRMNDLGTALNRAAEELASIFKTPGKTDPKNLVYLDELFDNRYLDRRMDLFRENIGKNQECLGDVEEYINEDELDLFIHKRLLEMVPDIFTSLGILGTFVGLVWGLKNFQPTNYEAMTSSVSALVDGIKVAFLTSIYGIAFSIIYTMTMKSEYSCMSESLQNFLEKFHSFVMPTAENESRNLLLSTQKVQTEAMEKLTEQFSGQLAESFEKVITPTFQKMQGSLDMLVNSVSRSHKEAVRDISNEFVKQMNASFRLQFQDFGKALDELRQAQKENAAFTSALYQNMSQQLNDSYMKQERSMKNMLTELGGIQNRYMSTAARILEENQQIQKLQQQDYQHVVDYLRDAEKSAAKFWVACNQTMQKYVEAASGGMDKVSAAGQAGTELLNTNRKLVDDFNRELQDFAQYQRLSYKTMEQVRRLLADIAAVGDRDVYLMSGNGTKESVDKMQAFLAQQAEEQRALLEEISKNIRELSRTAQKSRFSFFK